MSAYQAADYQCAELRFVDLINRYKAIGSEHDVDRAMAMDHLARVISPVEKRSRGAIAARSSPSSNVMVQIPRLPRFASACSPDFAIPATLSRGRAIAAAPIASHEAVNDEMNLAKELDHLGATLAMRAQSEQRPDLAAEAVTHGERAVAIFEKYLPADHYSLLGCKQNLGKFKVMAQSIGKMFPSGGEPSDDPVPAVPEGHPFAITQLLGRSWRLCEAHDYDGALALARDARHCAIRNFGNQSPLAGNAVAQMVGYLRRHCSYLLGEPTGTLSPAESFMMQIRAQHAAQESLKTR